MTRNNGNSVPSTGSKLQPIVVEDNSFALNGTNASYRFHIDKATGDLISDHFGGLVTEDPLAHPTLNGGGWSTQEHVRREFPDLGRGDFRSPAVRIRQAGTHAVSRFEYESYTIVNGKPRLPGLPSTFGDEDEVATLIIHMRDRVSSIRADLSYSIFPKHDAIARSITLKNESDKTVSIEKLASFSVDMPCDDYEMLQLRGEWFRECTRDRRKVEYGTQGFGSSNGFSSHHHNPFLSLVSPTTTESHGDTWGFSLVYTGSFNMEVEKSPQGLTRVLAGINPGQLSWPLGPGESFTSPECISVFSNSGIGDMSRKFHRLYRRNLITSKFVNEPRPVLLNSWEGLYFDFDENTIYKLAQESANLGVKLFVLDDGWFGGTKYPRIDDHAGLGDWDVNPARFPNGLKSLADKVRKLEAATSSKSQTSENLQFGIWFEPEMVNPSSVLYEQHPDWVLHAGEYPRTEARQQLALNLALPEVQDFVIASVANILQTVPITYIKWDHNRGIHESPTPNHHAYILGMYRVFQELTSRFPNVLWEGCASGGGRFDPGILQYFPQVWTSDNTDALDRISIQFGTSLVYPPSTMGAHISAVPNEVTGRIIPIHFRAHVAMMGGSFGLELNPEAIPSSDKAQLPALIALAERVNPIVINGDMWRLSLPGHSNHPAALFISEDGSQLVLFIFQIRANAVHNFPTIRLQGLDPSAMYLIDGKETRSGRTLLNGGVQYRFEGDYDSKVIFIERL
ncbi:Melibiase-domain-containing protein [Thelonectria olida]|uniref:Alpha-galactosidase n=1 Tax=Thelonectria olida TaxID=1576542 RepID=A0A9P9AJM3_9HYPO|nr:Melibiase-domain-containing protein [Thelonectria olida]